MCGLGFRVFLALPSQCQGLAVGKGFKLSQGVARTKVVWRPDSGAPRALRSLQVWGSF